MIDIKERISALKKEIPENVELVAVSKFHPSSLIMEAYNAGQKVFGESRVQEFLKKKEELPQDIKWHFIGHLQTNKARSIIGKTDLIESVDSEKLINLIDKESYEAGVVTNILMQVHVADEETKFGFLPEELISYFEERKFEDLKATHICGIMAMATNTDNEQKISEDFRRVNELFNNIRNNEKYGLRGFDKLSMGMSNDWKAAVKEGSNIVRIGSSIFGERQY